MDDQTTLAGEVARAFRDHGITAALTALIGGTMALIAAISSCTVLAPDLLLASSTSGVLASWVMGAKSRSVS